MWRTTGRTSSCNFNYLWINPSLVTQHEKKQNKNAETKQASATGGTAGCDALEATSTDHRPIIPTPWSRPTPRQVLPSPWSLPSASGPWSGCFLGNLWVDTKGLEVQLTGVFVWSFPTQLHGKTSRTVNPCNSWTLVPLPRMIYGLGNDNCDLLQIWSHPGKRQSLRSLPDISVRTSSHMHMPTVIVYCLAHPPLGALRVKIQDL